MARNFRCSDDTVAKTADGLLKGFFLDDLYVFHGIKYADARRFQLPGPGKELRTPPTTATSVR